MRTFTAALISISLLACGGVPLKNSPPPPQKQTPDEVAIQAERLINAAERELDERRPDEAARILNEAKAELRKPQLKEYPDDDTLKSRHRALIVRVPEVREQIRQADLEEKVTNAKTKINEALTTLDADLSAIKRGKPTNEAFAQIKLDFEAVGTALSEGRSLEPAHEEYRTFCAGVRAGIEEKKTKVDARFLKVAVARQKAALEAKYRETKRALSVTRGKRASEASFSHAEEIIRAFEATFSEGEGLEGKSRSYARFAAKRRAALTKARLSLENHQTRFKTKSQTKSLKEALATLKRALRGKTLGESEIETAESSINAVKEVLSETETLDSGDRSLRTLAKTARSRVKAAEFKLEKARIQRTLVGHQSSIEEALSQTEDALANLTSESDTTRFESAEMKIKQLESAIQKGDGAADQTKSYKKFVDKAEAKRTKAKRLLEKIRVSMGVALHRSKVESARSELEEALNALLTEAGPQEFDSTEARIKALQDVLVRGAAEGRRDADYGRYLSEVEAELEIARTQLQQRKNDAKAATSQSALNAATAAVEAAVAKVERGDATAKDFKDGEGALRDLIEAISQGRPMEPRSKTYAAAAVRAKELLKQARQTLKAGRVSASVGQQSETVKAAMREVDAALDALTSKNSQVQDIKTADKEIVNAERALHDGRPLEAQDETYKGLATQSRVTLRAAQDRLEVVQASMKFRDGPLADLIAALAALESDDKPSWEEARTKFGSCKTKGATLIVEKPKMAKEEFDVLGEALAAKAILIRCGEGEKEAEERLKK